MSSLHQDRLLVEGSGPVTGTAAALPTTRGTSRRALGSTEKKAISKAPTQRLGTAQRGGATQSTAVSTAAPRAKRAAGANAAAGTGALASRAKAATVKAATAKAATAKAATVKAATAARAAAVTKVANHTAGVRSARAAAAAHATPAAKARTTKAAPVKPAAAKAAPAQSAPVAMAVAEKAAPAAKPTAAKPTAAKPAAAKPAAAKTAAVKTGSAAKAAPAAKAPTAKDAPVAKAAQTAAEAKAAPTAKPGPARPSRAEPTVADVPAAGAAPRVRPTPHKRVPTVQAALAGSVPLADVADLAVADSAGVVVVRKGLPTDEASGGRVPRFLRRLPMARRRPALYLSAALVGAISLGAFSSQEPTAEATATVSSVSVAEQLGIEAAPAAAVVDGEATARLSELAASRNTRDAEQAVAMQVQAEADRIAVEAAAEAARPKAVMPVDGARLTSPFGARWGTLHAGIDLAAPMRTPEYAVMDGVVLEAGPASGFGLAVYLQHENGDVTVYGHMDEILVEAGQVVRAGDTIALVGNRGQSTGPHLHFEVHVGGLNGQKVDPLPWLRQAGVDV